MFKICDICGAEFDGWHNQLYCGKKCARVARYRKEKERQKEALRESAMEAPNNAEIIRINELARKEGLSYGQYVLKKSQDRPCDDCNEPICFAKNCTKWERWFKAQWRDLQRKAGVKIDGKRA